MAYRVSGTDLTAVANAIRTKGGTSAALSFPNGFVTAIGNIETQQLTTIVPEQTVTVSGSYTQLTFDEAIVDGEEYVVTINGTTKTLTAASQYGSVYLAFTTNTVMIDYSSPKMYLDVTDSSLYGTYTVKVEKVSGGATLITKSISANGTYNASSDNADGYSSVTVSVNANYVHGTFTPASSEKGSVKTITIPYTGTGYPVAMVIYPTDGAFNSESDIYASTKQKALICFSMAKANAGEAPDYGTSNIEKNHATTFATYKNSSTDPTNISSSIAKTALSFTSYAASGNTATNCVRFSSKTSMGVFIANTDYGFLDEIEYAYDIIYSA